jgi:spermidine/putrescine-binding protein
MNIALATPLKDGGLNSAFTYNGDILYAAMGSDLNAGIDPTSPKYIQYFDNKDDDPNSLHMHFIRPDHVPAMMDMMVINKDSEKNQNKKDNLYKIVNKVCLDSANETDDDNFENDISFQN